MITKLVYENDIKKHLLSCRGKNPIPARDELDALQEQQCRILGGHLISWLQEWGPELLRERAALVATRNWDVNPLICFQSDMPGLVAAREILRDEPGNVVWGLLADYESLATTDENYIYHVELRSFMTQVKSSELNRTIRARHPKKRSEKYYIHFDKSVIGPLFARGAKHLWKWDGNELVLLEEAVEAWVS